MGLMTLMPGSALGPEKLLNEHIRMDRQRRGLRSLGAHGLEGYEVRSPGPKEQMGQLVPPAWSYRAQHGRQVSGTPS